MNGYVFFVSLSLLPVSLVVFIFWFIHRFFPSHSFSECVFFCSFSRTWSVCVYVWCRSCLRCRPHFYLSVIKFGFLSPSHWINQITIICGGSENNKNRKNDATHRRINKTQNSEKKQIIIIIIIQPNINNNNFKLSMTEYCETIEIHAMAFYSCSEIVAFLFLSIFIYYFEFWFFFSRSNLSLILFGLLLFYFYSFRCRFSVQHSDVYMLYVLCVSFSRYGSPPNI